TVLLTGTTPDARPPAVARSGPMPLTADDPHYGVRRHNISGAPTTMGDLWWRKRRTIMTTPMTRPTKCRRARSTSRATRMTIAAVATVPIFIRPLGLSGERVAYRA